MAAFDHAHGAEGPTTQLQKKGLRHRGKELSRSGVISGLGILASGIRDGFSEALRTSLELPSRELTNPILGKGTSSTQKCFGRGYVTSQEGKLLIEITQTHGSFQKVPSLSVGKS